MFMSTVAQERETLSVWCELYITADSWPFARPVGITRNKHLRGILIFFFFFCHRRRYQRSCWRKSEWQTNTNYLPAVQKSIKEKFQSAAVEQLFRWREARGGVSGGLKKKKMWK